MSKLPLALLVSLSTAAQHSSKVDRIGVTSGSVTSIAPGRFEISDPVVRGTFPAEVKRGAELRFAYEGPSPQTQPLASGELRRQVGLKLRAMDSCNVLYVMWHFEPAQKIEVSVKRNAGLKAHRECGDKGYLKVPPELAIAPPAVEKSKVHSLRVEDRGQSLEVSIDGETVWRGALPPEASELSGPAGMRSDNVRLSFEAFTF